MDNGNSESEMNKALFVNLVIMFSSTAMQQLGKLVNPVTKSAEIDLQGAQASIDILVMLFEKTRGNLDKEEERLIKDAIANLQMNYVATAATAPNKEEAKKGGATAAGAAGETGPVSSASRVEKPANEGSPGKAPKFHKTYGEE